METKSGDLHTGLRILAHIIARAHLKKLARQRTEQAMDTKDSCQKKGRIAMPGKKQPEKNICDSQCSGKIK